MSKKTDKTRIISLLLCLLIAVIILATAIVLMKAADIRKGPAPEVTQAPVVVVEPTQTPALQVDPNAGALITPAPTVAEPGIAIPGWGAIKIPAGVTEAQVALENPSANEGWYYLTFELRLLETGEVIFTTGLIPPGQFCNKVELTRPMEPGEYPAVVHVQPYRMNESMTPTNNADLETYLIVG